MQDYLDKKQQDEGTIDQTFATDNIDKHDKKFYPKWIILNLWFNMVRNT